jgi:hypothetical protein
VAEELARWVPKPMWWTLLTSTIFVKGVADEDPQAEITIKCDVEGSEFIRFYLACLSWRMWDNG